MAASAYAEALMRDAAGNEQVQERVGESVAAGARDERAQKAAGESLASGFDAAARAGKNSGTLKGQAMGAGAGLLSYAARSGVVQKGAGAVVATAATDKGVQQRVGNHVASGGGVPGVVPDRTRDNNNYNNSNSADTDSGMFANLANLVASSGSSQQQQQQQPGPVPTAPASSGGYPPQGPMYGSAPPQQQPSAYPPGQGPNASVGRGPLQPSYSPSAPPMAEAPRTAAAPPQQRPPSSAQAAPAVAAPPQQKSSGGGFFGNLFKGKDSSSSASKAAAVPRGPVAPPSSASYITGTFTGPPPTPLPAITDMLPQERYAEKELKRRQEFAARQAELEQKKAASAAKGGFFGKVGSGLTAVVQTVDAAATKTADAATEKYSGVNDEKSLKRFRELGLPFDEKLQMDFHCSLVVGDRFAEGYIFISTNMVSFSGEIDKLFTPDQKPLPVRMFVLLSDIASIRTGFSRRAIQKGEPAAITMNDIPADGVKKQMRDSIMLFTNYGTLHQFYGFKHYQINWFEDMLNVLDHQWRASFR